MVIPTELERQEQFILGLRELVDKCGLSDRYIMIYIDGASAYFHAEIASDPEDSSPDVWEGANPGDLTRTALKHPHAFSSISQYRRGASQGLGCAHSLTAKWKFRMEHSCQAFRG